MAEPDDLFSPPIASTPLQQQHQDGPEQHQLGDSHASNEQSFNEDRSLRSVSVISEENEDNGCNRCNVCGFTTSNPHTGMANHLRSSTVCLEAFVQDQQFQVDGTDEEKVVKIALVLNECPAPHCHGGSHRKMPDTCFFWWKNTGWKTMKWKGEINDQRDVKKKLSIYRRNYRRNYRQRHAFTSQTSHPENSQHQSRDFELKCICNFVGPLGAHLRREPNCVTLLMKINHISTGSDQVEHLRKAIFDISLLLKFCPNPECLVSRIGEGPLEHLQRDCFDFLGREAVTVYGWRKDITENEMRGKLTRRKAYIQEKSRSGHLLGPFNYKRNLSEILLKTCIFCHKQGPLLEKKDHVMTSIGYNNWCCNGCVQDQTHGSLEKAARDTFRLGGSHLPTEDRLVAVRIPNSEDGGGRIVVMPAYLAIDLSVQSDCRFINNATTTVLVPKAAAAMDSIGDEAYQRALDVSNELKALTKFLTSRLLICDLTSTLTVLYRKKLADIKKERLTMLKGMMSTKKGPIVSRNPNICNMPERNPHYEVTKKTCLTNSCMWSDGYLQRRSDESNAIACINGQVKTKVCLAVIKNLAVDSPELANIIHSMADFHFYGELKQLISFAPLVLQFASSKVKLMLRHAIEKHYRNWDLNVQFEKDQWSITLTGFLYCAEYDNINRMIANKESGQRDVLDAVLRNPEVQPTASLGKQWIADHFGLTEEEAEVSLSLSNKLSLCKSGYCGPCKKAPIGRIPKAPVPCDYVHPTVLVPIR